MAATQDPGPGPSPATRVAFDNEHDPIVEQVAILTNDPEENLTWREALNTYRPAVWWAIAMSLQNVMEGYNISLGASLLVFPAFAEKYGSYYPDLGWQLTFQWQMAINLGAAAGGIVGAIGGGWLVERYGPRMTVMVAQVLLTGTIAITFCAINVQMLFAGTLANGIPWGVLASVGSIYSSEVCPTVLRGYIINFSNLSWTFGTLIAAIVLKPLVNVPTQWSYRIPFALQWIWPIPLFLIAYFAPNSPWWLIRRGDEKGALASVRRLTRGLSEEEVRAKFEVLKHTNEYEKSLRTESTYMDCFKGANLPRTEIACVVMSAQGVTGLVLAATPTYFMLQVGLSAEASLIVNICGTALGVIANFLCWALMLRFGRRPLFIIGLASISVVLFLIGILDLSKNPATLWAQSAFCIIWIGIYGAFVAPESYTIAGEISATRVRAQTISLSKSCFGLASVIAGIIQSYIVNPTGADIQAKSAFVWFGCSVLLLIWSLFRLPETKGRSYEELDVLFERGVKARGFKSKGVASATQFHDGEGLASVQTVFHRHSKVTE